MSQARILENAPWLTSGPTRRVLELLNGGGEEARVGGGGCIGSARFATATG